MRAGVALALIMALLLTVPANARAQDEVQLSPDGQTWFADLGTPLFDPGLRWAPGDVRTVDLWVRNDGEREAVMSVSAAVEDLDGLGAGGAVSLQVRRAGSDWEHLRTQEPSELGTVVPGAVDRLEVRATFEPESDNASMRRSLRFGLEVILTQATETEEPGSQEGPVPGDGAGPDEEAAGPLPGTGSSAAAGLTALAMLLLGVGAGLMRHSRKGSS